MRSITLQVTPTQYNEIRETIARDLAEASAEAVNAGDKTRYRVILQRAAHVGVDEVIGRLAVWSLPEEDEAAPNPNPYIYCTIRCVDTGKRDAPELVALYYRKADLTTHAFVLGAVWHNDHWGYHS